MSFQLVLPDAIKQWLQLPDPHKKAVRYRTRIDRLTEFAKQSYDNAQALEGAWRALDVNKKSDDTLLDLFLTWPDEVTSQPFPAIYGARVVDHQEEKKRYSKGIHHIDAVLGLLRPEALGQLLSDVPAEGTGRAALNCFRLDFNRIVVIQSLRSLRALLNVSDPKRKYLTKQPFAEKADLKTYTILLAELNRHLESPQHAAIATIANANLPNHQVTGDAIGKAWKRHFKDGIFVS